MRILAFDQASRTSGWSLFEDGNLVEYGKFTFDDSNFGIRLVKIHDKVKSLIDKYNPDEVVFEDIQLQSSFGNNVDTFKKLAEVFGVIYELLTELNIPNRAVLSTVWKSKLGLLHGKGQNRAAQKREAQTWVFNTYGVRPTEDECDSICLGMYASLTQPQKGFDWSE